MTRFRAGRAVFLMAAVAVLATACSQGSDGSAAPRRTGGAPDTAPGQVRVEAPGVDLSITDAVVHLGPGRTGTLTMTVRHGEGVPEHLDMVATPGGGRGRLTGTPKGTDGLMTTAGILLPANTTVAFGAKGPGVTFTDVRGVTAAHTLPLALEFGVARLVRLTAIVSPH